MRIKCDWCKGSGGPVPPGDEPCSRCGGSGKVEFKITGATSLLELQKLLSDMNASVTVDYTISAGCWRASVSKRDDVFNTHYVGIGRDVGEAIANALHNYENHIIQERSQ